MTHAGCSSCKRAWIGFDGIQCDAIWWANPESEPTKSILTWVTEHAGRTLGDDAERDRPCPGHVLVGREKEMPTRKQVLRDNEE